MNIMIVTNSGYLEPACVMLNSLFENHTDIPMDIYLPYEDLTEAELEELKEFCGHFPGKELHPLRVGSWFKERVSSLSGINVDTYYRILGLQLLPEELERILYLDVDMIIKGNLEQFYQTDLSGAAFAVCEDIYGMINGFHEENLERLKIPAGYSYFNAGVMLFHLDYLREHHGAEQMLDNIYANYRRYLYNDQDVMNEMYYDRLIWAGWDEYNCPPAWYMVNRRYMEEGILAFADYKELPELLKDNEKFTAEYQNLTRQIAENAKIIHYMGDTKPWSSTRKPATVFELFDTYYDKYHAGTVEKCRDWGLVTLCR